MYLITTRENEYTKSENEYTKILRVVMRKGQNFD